MLKMFSGLLVERSYRHSDGMRRSDSVENRKRSLRLESLESRQLLSVSPMDNSDSEWILSTENQTVSTVIPPSETLVSPTAEQWEQLRAIRDLYGPWTLEQSELVQQFYSFWETLGVSSDNVSETTTTSFGDTLTLGLDASAVDAGLQTLEDWDAEQDLLESDSEASSRCGGGGCLPSISYGALYGGGSVACTSSGDTELFLFQQNATSATATVSAQMGCTGGVGRIFVVDPVGYWTVSGDANFTWTKPSNIANSAATRDFDFVFYVDVNNNAILDIGEVSVTLGIYIGYAEIRTVDFTQDHAVLKTNWKQAGDNNAWVKDDTFTYAGTPINTPEWDSQRKTSTGEYVSFGASYTKGSHVSVASCLEVDTHGRAYRITGNSNNSQNPYLNMGTSLWSTAQGLVFWSPTSQTALPSYVTMVNSVINWSVSTLSAATGAGTSGNHTIYVTYDTPIQSYTTDNNYLEQDTNKRTQSNETTEVRLAWACNVMSNANTTEGAADAIRNVLGHGCEPNMQYNWDAWSFRQNRIYGDCGTEAALAVATLGQIGIAATHELAWGTSDNDATASEERLNGRILRLPNNNYEGFFTIVSSTGGVWGYTCYPIFELPYKSSNLHLEVLNGTFRGYSRDQYGNLILNNVDVVQTWDWWNPNSGVWMVDASLGTELLPYL